MGLRARYRWMRIVSAGLLLGAAPLVHAATTINWSDPAVVSDSAVASTVGSANITVSTGTWQVGDVIRFTGTTATTNPFGTTATRYYIVGVSGSTIQVSTTPGGTALNATNTTTASTTQQAQDWFTLSNWTGGTAPNSSSVIANFNGNKNSAPATVINGNVTVYGLTNSNSTSGTDVTLVSGASGTGLYTLTFATDDATTPKMTLANSSNFLIFLGTNTAGSMALKIGGTQGLIFNSAPGGAITGSGTAATSTAPGKAIRLQNVDWSTFFGGIQVERGFIQLVTSGQLPNQTLTIGNAQTTTNNLLAGLNMNGQNATVDALAGTSLGRIFGSGTLTVGNNNGAGTYAGSLGLDFTGATTATNLTKGGSGTETISGIMGGSGVIIVNGGVLALNGANSFTGAATINSGGTVQLGNAAGLGTTAGTTTVNSGATLDLNGQTITETLSVAGSGVGSLGALVNSNTNTAAVVSSEITNGASLTVGGAGDITLQRVRSGGSPFVLTKIGAGTLTLGNASTTTHFNLQAIDIESASTVNFNTVATGNFLVVDRGLKIAAGGTVRYTGGSNNMIQDNSEVIVSNGTLDMNGLSDTAGKLTIGDGTNNGVISGAGSTYTVNPTYNLFGQNTSGGASTIEAMSGSVSVNLAGSGIALNKTTAGEVTLLGNNSYSGITTISQGTLFVNGTHSGAGGYTVSGGTLAGGGTITTAGNAGIAVAAGGRLAPGSLVGTAAALTMGLGSGSLDISGAVAATASGAMAFDLTSPGASDKIILSNAASILDIGSGVLEFDDFAFTLGPDVSTGIYTLIDTSSGIVGTLGANLSGTMNGAVVADLEFADNGQDLVLNVTSAPEPGTPTLLSVSLAGLLKRRRRFRAKLA